MLLLSKALILQCERHFLTLRIRGPLQTDRRNHGENTVSSHRSGFGTFWPKEREGLKGGEEGIRRLAGGWDAVLPVQVARGPPLGREPGSCSHGRSQNQTMLEPEAWKRNRKRERLPGTAGGNGKRRPF